jgi:hypothetical protein
MGFFDARQTLRIAEPDPFGDVTIAPVELTGRPEAELARDMARDMANELLAAQPQTDSEALRHLRTVFPDTPLTTRVAALAALMRR